MCKRAQYLHNSRKSVPLQRVFHSTRQSSGGERPYGGAGEYHPPSGNVLCCQRGRPGGQDSDDNRRTYL